MRTALRFGAAAGAAVVGLAFVVGVVCAAAAAPAVAGPVAATSGAAAPAPDSRVLVLGVPGLRWDELSATRTPHLWRLATSGSTGALIVRGAHEATPAADGWGTLSAGNRVRAPSGLARVRPPPGPAVVPAQYPDMAALRAAQAGEHTGAQPGALGEAVRQGGRCVTAVGGAGALLAASDADGRVFGYGTEVGGHPCPQTVAEPDVPAGVSPLQRLAAADALAGRLAGMRRDEDTLLVVSVSDPPGGAHVGVAIAVGPSFAAGTELTSASTGRVPFVQLVDVAPTLLDLLGIEAPASMIGQPWGASSGAVSLDRRQARYADLDAAARQVRRAVPLVLVPAVGAAVLLFGGGGALLAVGTRTGRPRLAAGGRQVARLTAYCAAALPAACFLANLVPWWRSPVPVVLAAVAGAELLVVGVAVAGPWRRNAPMGPFTAVVFVTFAALVVDVVSGAHLQLSSVLGYNPLVAGRFAGIGNPAFGALAASALLTATLLAVRLRRPVLTVAAIAAVAVLTDGAPRFGADVGGVIALVPAFALLATVASGRRPTLRPTLRGVLVAAGATLAVVAFFAAVDLASPPGSRTHIGRFAADLLGGSDGQTLRRKWDADVGLLTRNVATLLVVPVTAACTVLLARAGRGPGTARFARALRRLPLLRAGLWACVLAAGLGLVANDSGVVVPAVMMLLAVPAGVLAATDRLLAAADAPDAADAPAAPAAADAPAAPAARAGPAPAGRDEPASAGPNPRSPI